MTRTDNGLSYEIKEIEQRPLDALRYYYLPLPNDELLKNPNLKIIWGGIITNIKYDYENCKIILLALTTCLTSCYEDYTHDYETTNVGFALQNPLRTVISDRDMPIYVGVSLGGKREVDMNDWAKFTLDASLLEGTPLTLLPEEYYILEDPEIFKVRKSNLPVADVEIKFTDAFYRDPLSLTTHYALPFKVTESSMNTIREGADYSIVAIKYVSSFSGVYYLQGEVSEVDDNGNIIEGTTVVYKEKT